jgi:ABC-type multidrug transport system permease subunit
MPRSTVAVLITAALIVAACTAFLIWGLNSMPDLEMGVHGWVALVLGTLLSVVVGGGLAAILIISRRRGYDEMAHEAFRESEPDI